MKLGLSTYSLAKAIEANELTVVDAVQWVADNGGDHMAIMSDKHPVVDNPDLAEQITEKAKEVGIELSAYTMSSNFIQETQADFNAEVSRIKRHLDVVNRMGIKQIRHDVTQFKVEPEQMTIHYFEEHLEQMVEGCRQVADYAAQYGITTTIENHGYCVQASDRVQRVLHNVNRDNFKTTLDVGNFLIAEEDPLAGVIRNLPYAANVHFKDFYIRPYYENPGGGQWFRSVNGNYLRGAIVGHGELPIREMIRLVKQSGFDGYITIEFEGMEDCRLGTKIGMDNVRRLWDEIKVQ